jgi:TetR/AcrR family transcriptional repressor of mexJK operon
MATRTTSRPVGRPIDSQKLEAILDAGWAMFLERGVEAVSLEAVAARAGVAKATLYKHFADKPALFEAGVLREMEKIEAAQKVERGRSVPAADLATTLQEFGLGIMGFIFSDPAVAFYNALAGELSRHPQLAGRFYALGPGRTRANLANILAAAAERGELEIEDPEEAAEHLFGLWQGFSNFQLSLGVEGKKIRREIPRRVDRAIAAFIKAYAPRQRP